MVGESTQEDVAGLLPCWTEAVVGVKELSDAMCGAVKNVSEGAFC